MMAVRPIIFSAPMVRALIDGRKTMTRRLAWNAIEVTDDNGGAIIGVEDRPSLWQRAGVGDLLWVRETWQPHSLYAHMKPSAMPETKVFYRADDAYAPSNTPWVPPIHMPRWASRLTLEVTGVKVERLQQISEADAVAEGVPADFLEHIHGPAGFRDIWESIHKPGSWDANPWVVAISFKVHKANVDALAALASGEG